MVKLHERKFVSADPDKCNGCQVCEYACTITKEKSFNPIKSRIRVVRLNQICNLAVTCRMCEDPPCVTACPRDAVVQSEKSGIINIDEDKCDGCGWCIEACDYGAIMLHSDRKVVYVCDLCEDKGEPQCIKWCPDEALSLETCDTVAQKSRISAAKNLFQEAKQK
jgi:Fe-S-cluster-containing dehydrogenase component